MLTVFTYLPYFYMKTGQLFRWKFLNLSYLFTWAYKIMVKEKQVLLRQYNYIYYIFILFYYYRRAVVTHTMIRVHHVITDINTVIIIWRKSVLNQHTMDTTANPTAIIRRNITATAGNTTTKVTTSLGLVILEATEGTDWWEIFSLNYIKPYYYMMTAAHDRKVPPSNLVTWQ